MRFLERERTTLSKFLPGLDEELATLSLAELEQPGNPGLETFRRHGGAGLLVPVAHGGAGASAVDALLVQRAIGARSPSLAVATTMHHFSMASLVTLSEASQGFEWMLMEGVARTGKLMASGFAEGQPGSSILKPTMHAEMTPDGLRVSGSKKPCSLARSMDLLTASVRVPTVDGTGDQLAVVLIPAESEGLTVTPFWQSSVLTGAESEEVTIDRVLVPEELIVRTNVPPGQSLDFAQLTGFLWFELLITASYLGATSALVERALRNERIPAPARTALVIEVEAAAASLESVAMRMASGQHDQALLATCLLARYAAQDAIARVVPRTTELLGGFAFMASAEIAYLSAAAYPLSMHPPTRSRMAEPIANFLAGELLNIV